MANSSVKVQICGQVYSINGDAPEEYIKELADYTHTKMEEVASGTSTTNPVQIAILAALNIADEYFQLKKIKSGMDSEVEKRALDLIAMLDEGLIGDFFSRTDLVSKNNLSEDFSP